MYEELIKRLRLCAEGFNCRRCEYEFVNGCRSKLNKDAADAIEELEAAANDYKDQISALRTAVKRQSHIIQAKDRDLQRAIDAYPRWISVEERLPKPYEDVLLRFPHNQAAGFHDGDCGWGVYSGDGMYTDVAPEEMHPTHWATRAMLILSYPCFCILIPALSTSAVLSIFIYIIYINIYTLYT